MAGGRWTVDGLALPRLCRAYASPGLRGASRPGWRCRACATPGAEGECARAAGVGVGLGLVAGGVAVAEGLAVRDGPADGDGDGDGELLGRLVGDGELL